MDLQLTKMELIEMLINTNEESVLMRVKAILESDKGRLSDEDYEIINQRRKKHLSGESKSYTWQAVRKNIAS